MNDKTLHEIDKMTRVALQATAVVQTMILEYFKKKNFEVRQKEDGSLQTSVDVSVEDKLIKIIKNAFPEHGIDGEESGILPSSSPYQWIIDPIDGTDNFVLGIPHFCTSLTVLKNEVSLLTVVNEPITNEVFVAQRDRGAWLNGTTLSISTPTTLRKARIMFIPNSKTKHDPATIRLRDRLYKTSSRLLDTWAPTLDWCFVSSGRTDALVVVRDEPRGDAAGTLLLAEAKGRITDFGGGELNKNSSGCIIGSNGSVLHDYLMQLVCEYYRP